MTAPKPAPAALSLAALAATTIALLLVAAVAQTTTDPTYMSDEVIYKRMTTRYFDGCKPGESSLLFFALALASDLFGSSLRLEWQHQEARCQRPRQRVRTRQA